MIRKLKLKFIFTNMLLITAVMIVAFVTIYINTAKQLEENSISAMYDIAEQKQESFHGIFGPAKEQNSRYSYLSTYTINLDTRNNTCYIEGFGNIEDFSDEEVQYVNNLINSVLKSNEISDEEQGVLKEYNMRYYCKNDPVGLRIVLLDKRYEDDNLRQLMISSVCIGLVAFVAFLIVSIIVSGIAVKPIERSINQQKQLISDMSHELKTPITVISTNTDIVLSHSDSMVKDEEQWLGYIKDEANRMSDLVSMMLYLAKSDESSKQIETRVIDISNAAFEIVLPFETVCFENGKSFSYDIKNELLVKCNEGSIKQLMAILLDNAVKYSNENGNIYFKLVSHNDKALITVFNTGEPIPKESLPYIFDRFYRVDKARSRDMGGSGLGLAIAKSIIDQNNGSISVTSDENGTVFSCMFDIVKSKKEKDNI